MANQQLYNKEYKIPQDILDSIRRYLIKYPFGEGTKRAKYLLNNELTYQGMKRLKNYFDYYNPKEDDKIQYELAGGDKMKYFIDTELAKDRDAVNREKEIKRDVNVDVNLGTRPYNPFPELNESIEREENLNAAIAAIVDEDNKILLLKRREEEGLWGSGKYGLVGGKIENGETPEEACIREIKEETGLVFSDLKERFIIDRLPNNTEYVFVCRYSGDPTDVEINDEHTNYGWFSISEIKYLDTVPNLMEYLSLSFKEY